MSTGTGCSDFLSDKPKARHKPENVYLLPRHMKRTAIKHFFF